MKFLNKILKPRYLLVLLALGGGTLFTMLQATSNQCVSTTDGDLTEQSTFGTYNNSDQSGCGSNLALDYIIGQGTLVFWSGFGGSISGNVEVQSGGTLDINGNANFEGTLTNAGTLSSGVPKTATAPKVPSSDFYTISNISGHTVEDGTTSTFNVVLKDQPFTAVLSDPTAPSSEFYNISNPSGHTSEVGTTSTFNVALDESPVPATPASPTASSGDFYTVSNPSGHTKEDGTTSTFNVKITNTPFPSNPSSTSAPSSDFYGISTPSNSGHTKEDRKSVV